MARPRLPRRWAESSTRAREPAIPKRGAIRWLRYRESRHPPARRPRSARSGRNRRLVDGTRGSGARRAAAARLVRDAPPRADSRASPSARGTGSTRARPAPPCRRRTAPPLRRDLAPARRRPRASRPPRFLFPSRRCLEKAARARARPAATAREDSPPSRGRRGTASTRRPRPRPPGGDGSVSSGRARRRTESRPKSAGRWVRAAPAGFWERSRGA